MAPVAPPARAVDLEDLERIRRALRAGVRAVQVEMRDPATRRALQPAVIAYEADGGNPGTGQKWARDQAGAPVGPGAGPEPKPRAFKRVGKRWPLREKSDRWLTCLLRYELFQT